MGDAQRQGRSVHWPQVRSQRIPRAGIASGSGSLRLGKVSLFCLALLLAGSEPRVRAQAPEREPLPIQIQNPRPVTSGGVVLLVPLNGSLQITGSCMSDNRHRVVIVRVTAPRGPSIPLTAQLDSRGDFAVNFSQTSVPGRYQVEAIAPDGNGKASSAFQVVSPGEIADGAANTVNGLLMETNTILETAEHDLSQAPVSPPQQEAEKKLAHMQDRLRQGTQVVQSLRHSLHEFNDLAAKAPALEPQFPPLWKALGDWQFQAAQRQAEIQAKLQATQNATQVCGMLNAAIEALNLIAGLLDPIDALKDIVSDWVQQKLGSQEAIQNLDAMVKLAKDDWETADKMTEAFCGEGMEATVAAHEVPESFRSLLTGILSYLGKTAFLVYCQKFEGPFEADFHVAFTESPQWSYHIQLSGRLLLMYPRNAKQTTHLTGYFEGNASQFELTEHLITLLDPSLRPYVLMRKVFTPPVAPFVSLVGQGFRRLGAPGYFEVPVEGDMVNRDVTLHIRSAVTDFSEAFRARVFYLMIAPVVPVPFTLQMSMPTQNAYWILSRGMGETSHWQVSMEGEKMLLEHEFQRKFVAPASPKFWVTWEIKVKACNPGCLEE